MSRGVTLRESSRGATRSARVVSRATFNVTSQPARDMTSQHVLLRIQRPDVVPCNHGNCLLPLSRKSKEYPAGYWFADRYE